MPLPLETMKLFTSSQIREWDAYTVAHEPVSQLQLMERAAGQCARFIADHFGGEQYCVVCGTGNNGGDGLVIARLLRDQGYSVRVWIAGNPESGSESFRANFMRLCDETDIAAEILNEDNPAGTLRDDEIAVDALFGRGINRPVEGWLADLIREMNERAAWIISVDLPSGFLPDLFAAQKGAIVRAHTTLMLECPVAPLLFPENADYMGEGVVLGIGLHPDFAAETASPFHFLTREEADGWIPRRERFGHKRTFGHVQVMAGSFGKMGAAVLCARAVLRAGAGLVTASVPQSGYAIMQTALPECMCECDDGEKVLTSSAAMERADVLAIGPGIGTAPETSLLVRRILKETRIPLVLDADALNLIGSRELTDQIPQGSILTPHPGEFDRLFGHHEDSFHRFRTLREKAVELGVHIVLKGAYSWTATKDGELWVNLSGNAGMATAGSGDVLTGIIAALVARGMPADRAAVAGAYLHGLAGDCAASEKSNENLLAGDLADCLPQAMNLLRSGD
jgi:ADP-dependent NAD(P)H-hydrate dehydratase / NAD(P)H-hydrate epimerase